MKRAKVEKHLAYSREHLEFLREEYVKTVKNPYWKMLDNYTALGRNPYKEKVRGIREEMEEMKAKIARFERILL